MIVLVIDLKYGFFLGKWFLLFWVRMYMKYRLIYRFIK